MVQAANGLLDAEIGDIRCLAPDDPHCHCRPDIMTVEMGAVAAALPANEVSSAQVPTVSVHLLAWPFRTSMP